MNFPIDWVFPYVNCDDIEWQQSYMYERKKLNLPINEKYMNGVRYRDLGFLPYLIRGLDKYCNWLNHIFIIVATESQIPKWLNTNHPKIRIVLHKDIIPEEYLPTFNSTTIEMFLKNIPDLSEHFIYANDDMFPIDYLDPSSFFDENGIPKYKLNLTRNKDKNQYRRVCFRQYEFIRKTFNIIPDHSGRYTKPRHFPQPMVLTTVKEAFMCYERQILEGISPFRTENNFNQYIYTLYQSFGHEYINSSPSSCYSGLTTAVKCTEIATAIWTHKYKLVCLNDQDSTNKIAATKLILPAFKFILGEKCELEK